MDQLSRLLRSTSAWLLAGTLAIPGAALAELGQPPMRFESQDTRGWSVVPRAELTRDGVAALFNSVYLPGWDVPLQWTGSVAGCDAGTTNVAHQQAVIDRVNYFRALAGLPPVTLLQGTPTIQVQAAALMMSANGMLSHTPPASWQCYSADGAMGAGNANLALGYFGVDSVDKYVDDPGGNNAAVGHRRWVLFPPRASMATGDTVSPTRPPHPSNGLYVFGPSTTKSGMASISKLTDVCPAGMTTNPGPMASDVSELISVTSRSC